MLCVAGVPAGASAEAAGLSANVRDGGIDSHQRDQAGSNIRRGRAMGIVAAPADAVTAIVSDYKNYREFMPHFVTSRVLSQRGSEALLYVEVAALRGASKLWAEMKLSMETKADTRVIKAKMLKGNLKGLDAEWRVTPVDATRTLVTFELCANPKFRIPFASRLVSEYNEKEARSSILALRRQLSKKQAP